MIAQFKTLKALNTGDIIDTLDGVYYGIGSSYYPMTVGTHPWCAPDGISILIQGGIGSTESATFIDSTSTPYTVTSVPINYGTINGVEFPILP